MTRTKIVLTRLTPPESEFRGAEDLQKTMTDYIIDKPGTSLISLSFSALPWNDVKNDLKIAHDNIDITDVDSVNIDRYVELVTKYLMPQISTNFKIKTHFFKKVPITLHTLQDMKGLGQYDKRRFDTYGNDIISFVFPKKYVDLFAAFKIEDQIFDTCLKPHVQKLIKIFVGIESPEQIDIIRNSVTRL